jgi:hypothetical protein
MILKIEWLQYLPHKQMRSDKKLVLLLLLPVILRHVSKDTKLNKNVHSIKHQIMVYHQIYQLN